MPKQGETARRPVWPEDAVFRRLVLDVESDSCEYCGATLHVCDHRFHRIHTLPRAGAGNASPMSPGSCCQIVASTFLILSYHTGISGFMEAGELGFEGSRLAFELD